MAFLCLCGFISCSFPLTPYDLVFLKCLQPLLNRTARCVCGDAAPPASFHLGNVHSLWGNTRSLPSSWGCFCHTCTFSSIQQIALVYIPCSVRTEILGMPLYHSPTQILAVSVCSIRLQISPGSCQTFIILELIGRVTEGVHRLNANLQCIVYQGLETPWVLRSAAIWDQFSVGTTEHTYSPRGDYNLCGKEGSSLECRVNGDTEVKSGRLSPLRINWAEETEALMGSLIPQSQKHWEQDVEGGKKTCLK